MRTSSSKSPMRKHVRRSGLLLAAAVACLSLAGCSAPLFKEHVFWSGGTLYNDKHLTIERPARDMSLSLHTDGTGSAENIPKGHPKHDEYLCIVVTSEDLYTGPIRWRKVDKSSFEIAFADSKYRVAAGPGKFEINWTEVRIYNCNPGVEYWAMYDLDSWNRN